MELLNDYQQLCGPDTTKTIYDHVLSFSKIFEIIKMEKPTKPT